MAITTAPASSALAHQILDHTAPNYSFTFSPFLRKTYGHGLAPNRPICKAFLAGHCPLGASCPDRHETNAAASSQNSSYNSLVCKHWLRALCKKGASCEFLHEYNLRKMPECNFFVRNGYCSNGDECLYLHIDPSSKLPPCPHYERGFCPLGPNCSKKHVRRTLCPYYLAGFCPDGKQCKEGTHPRWDKNLEKPVAKSEKTEEEQHINRDEGPWEEERDFRRDREERGDRPGYRPRGRGGWRGKGDKRYGRGRGHH